MESNKTFDDVLDTIISKKIPIRNNEWLIDDECQTLVKIGDNKEEVKNERVAKQ